MKIKRIQWWTNNESLAHFAEMKFSHTHKNMHQQTTNKYYAYGIMLNAQMKHYETADSEQPKEIEW